MKVSDTDAAKVIHEVERAQGADTFAFAETTPEYRDDRGREVREYLQTGEVPASVTDVAVFKAVIDALR